VANSDNPTKEEAIASSLVPYHRDDPRAHFLISCACGFSIREALKYIGRSKSALSLWRRDPRFVDLESRLPEIKKTLGMEYTSLEFLRNFRMVLEKDFQVIRKSLDKNQVLTVQESSYLIKMRSQYTPQQLQIIEALVAAEGKSGFDFTRIILQAFRREEGVTITAISEPQPAVTDGAEDA